MGRPVRVLQLIDSLARAGAEQSLTTLAPHLVEQGVDLHVAYLLERDGLREDLMRHGIPTVSLDGPEAGRRTWLRRTGTLIDDLYPDVVHTTLYEADLAGRRAAARRNIPCVSSLVNTAYGRMEGGGVSRLKVRAAQAADAATARHVTRFHAVTQHVATVMSRRLLIPLSRIEIIPRGRDPVALGRRSATRRQATRARLDIPSKAPVLLAVGRHEPQKGLDVLLRALPPIRAKLPDVRVLIAGREGRATRSLRELADGLGLGGGVTFLGMRDDVADLLAAADVFVFPSLWEGAGGTLLEAMALECPIVSSRLPTLLETVDDATAAFVSPGNPEELAKAVITVIADRQSSQARMRAARVQFVERFTIQSSARSMAALYRRVAVPA
jgi:glycosyltransferase involved in cell wall biosynthesis